MFRVFIIWIAFFNFVGNQKDMTFEEKHKALGIRSDEELAADLKKLLAEKEQIEKEQAETNRLLAGLEAEKRVAELLDNILSIGKTNA